MAQREMTVIDMRDLLNHTDHFGNGSVVRKMGRKWFIDFRGFGFPSPFVTKNAAMDRVSEWRMAIRRRMDEMGIDRYGNKITT
ncbi:MAG TPA: hypothetical protein VL574_16935 [Stellaceae bacterium]|nr:hypothetical protein [Stellaceae bacterium]